jgi:hypothetical protein
MVLDRIAVLGARHSFFLCFHRNIIEMDAFFLVLAAVLGDILVTDTIGHDFLLHEILQNNAAAAEAPPLEKNATAIRQQCSNDMAKAWQRYGNSSADAPAVAAKNYSPVPASFFTATGKAQPSWRRTSSGAGGGLCSWQRRSRYWRMVCLEGRTACVITASMSS